MLSDRLVGLIRTIIEKETYLKKQEDGTYLGVIFVDYNDELSPKTIEEITKEKSPKDAFYDTVDSFGTDDYEFAELLETVRNHWDDEEEGCYSEHQDLISEWLNENVSFDFPYDHYLKQKIKVDILVNAGDGNYDYTLNNFCSYNSGQNEIIDEKSSILWLVRQQGYSKRQLNKAVRKGEYGGSRLLKSIHVECENITTHMNALAFFIKMTLGEFLEYLEDPRDITLSEKTNCGLYDPWNGAGGPLEIELEKPVVIPKKYVEMSIDGGRGYDVDSIYGIYDNFWRETLAS
jgi:hypothetical protein